MRVTPPSVVLLVVAVTLHASCAAKHDPPSAVTEEHAESEEEHAHVHHVESVESMSSDHLHLGPHFKWTATRPPNPADRRRADQIVRTLRDTLARYKDYRVAVKDGYHPFLPDVPQPRYHFTNKWYAFKGALRFNPNEPTSLLYKKSADGYELIGAMYTAPKRMTEDQLNDRIPLSVAQWHAHVNICLPPRGEAGKADPMKFGFKGSIVRREDCQAAGGRFYPQIFGWMVHVYPFEVAPEKIWTH